MAINFPTSIDTLTNPAGTDKVSVVDHAEQHADANDAIEAIQAKVGADSSAVTSSHDYKLGDVTSTAKAVSTAGNQTIAGDKTFTGTTTTDGLEAGSGDINNTGNITSTGDVEGATVTVTGTSATDKLAKFNASDNIISSGIEVSTDGTLADNSDTEIPTEQAVKTYVDNATASVGGAPDVIYPFIGECASGAILPTVFSDDLDVRIGYGVGSSSLLVQTSTEFRAFDASTHFGGYNIVSWSIYNGDIYVLIENAGTSPDTYFVYRINTYSSLASSTVTLLDATTNSVLAQTNSAMKFTMDNSGDFYFTYQGGASATQTVLAKSTLTADELQTPSTITPSGTISTPAGLAVMSNGDIIMTDAAENYERFNSSGTSQTYIVDYTPTIQNGTFNYYDGSINNFYLSPTAQPNFSTYGTIKQSIKP